MCFVLRFDWFGSSRLISCYWLSFPEITVRFRAWFCAECHLTIWRVHSCVVFPPCGFDRYRVLFYSLTGELVGRLEAYANALGGRSMSWSPNGTLLAVGSYDQCVRLVSRVSWKPVAVLRHVRPKAQVRSRGRRRLSRAFFPTLAFRGWLGVDLWDQEALRRRCLRASCMANVCRRPLVLQASMLSKQPDHRRLDMMP